ncbi:single-stranded DNA-binding protein [Salipaludibacillus agaradhaerens]|jgi:single-strand DNA-binding protein|uniref:Single-stranded DNA-binding protein n=1 Tax=Salipaludibacillus agaradhaerens TaxID=76935 RepID=A0A9Q4B1Z7_SALAG|nr:single-stranded DNA-binding protein [Salipaludibacillus agaradhaerens]MCR6096883.1 single-stranded DNA-binding protein [Salipaludibacillus agaradhaerens]MCR6116727.1 single-stranded DNA-binding protein [Salipaludibacillus agaradhaerens]
MNKFIITGNLTKDPELAYSGSGVAYCKFTVAVQRNFKKDEVDFFNCTCFKTQAENLANYQVKGNKLLVEGEVQIDKKDDKYFTNVIANNVEYLTPKGQSGQQTQQNNTQQKSQDDPFADGSKTIDINDDDLPF